MGCVSLGVSFNAEAVLRSLSPSVRRAAGELLRPYRRLKCLSLLSALFFSVSSLLLCSRGEGLAKLGVPADKIPHGPFDVAGHLKYAPHQQLANTNS